ncbi:hypothetical protein BASA81_017780 [Batrachochytrium salamandrivorans]|nr:hypothetical protein BASA81_017780 [Batrachochytrium salamandrivorans]
MNQQQQQRFFDPRQTANPIRPDSFVNLPSVGPAPKSSDDMDIDFVAKEPTISYETEHRVNKDFVLFCGELVIKKHVETIGFYVTSLCHGIILGYSWLERHNPQVNWESRMVDFGSNYCFENCCVGSTRIQGLGKPPRTSDISPKPSIPEPEPPDRPSNFSVDPNINLSLFKDSRL